MFLISRSGTFQVVLYKTTIITSCVLAIRLPIKLHQTDPSSPSTHLIKLKILHCPAAEESPVCASLAPQHPHFFRPQPTDSSLPNVDDGERRGGAASAGAIHKAETNADSARAGGLLVLRGEERGHDLPVGGHQGVVPREADCSDQAVPRTDRNRW